MIILAAYPVHEDGMTLGDRTAAAEDRAEQAAFDHMRES